MKKLFAVHDSKGHILAAVLLDGNQDENKPKPVAGRGQRTVELDLTHEQLQSGIGAVCNLYRVDAKLKKLVAVSRKVREPTR